MSFLKYHGETQNGSGPISWSRAEQDGAPFRGQVPLLREEEFEHLVERVYDTKYGTFDTSQPEQEHHGRTLRFILDARRNDWFSILDYQTKWGEDQHGKPVMFVFVVWSEAYQELPTKYHQGRLITTQGSTNGHSEQHPGSNSAPPIM